MPTTNQLVRKNRRKPRNKSKHRLMQENPQRRGTVLKAWVMLPRKPNSANRKVCRVRFADGNEATCHIPGEGHNIVEHNTVLVRGGGPPDLSGVKYRVVRGTLDCIGVTEGANKQRRNQGRSKYGSPKPSKAKK